MQITPKEITVGELTDGYEDKPAEGGVVGYGGKLDIRPPYQREFVYKDKQRDAVINTVTNNFPLNVMYWAVREDGSFEVIDGQQRTLSICQYVKGDFSVKVGCIPEYRAFHNLLDDEKEQILNYKLMIYRCTGKDSEKLDWFRTINIAGEEHTPQELRNTVYAGSWLSDAKRHFSKTGCAAYQIGIIISMANRYVSTIWRRRLIGFLKHAATRTSLRNTWASISTMPTPSRCGIIFRR